MKNLALFVKNDIKPAFGCTEPGAIAYACAKARDIVPGTVLKVEMSLNSGIYKNALTCPIPGTPDMGKDFAAALGAVAGDSAKGLLVIENTTEEDLVKARQLLSEGKVNTDLSGIDSKIYIYAKVTTDKGVGEVTVKNSHTNIVEMKKDGEVIFQNNEETAAAAAADDCVNNYTFREIYDYCMNGPIEEMMFLQEAFLMDTALLDEGIEMDVVPMTKILIENNSGKRVSDDWQKNAEIASCGAIEARLSGAAKPAMSLTGSGSHGILAMMPVFSIGKAFGKTDEEIVRAGMLSCLTTMYIKSYSGKLSALCGCAVAGGTGSAVAICHLLGGNFDQLCQTIDNMAASVVGMICHGGNPGCIMKALAGIGAAIKSAQFALKGVSIDNVHAILGNTPEKTMQNMAYISSPGMELTEKYILDIMKNK